MRLSYERRVMEFCRRGLRLAARGWMVAMCSIKSVEAASLFDGDHPDAVWSAACRARRNPRSAPPARAARSLDHRQVRQVRPGATELRPPQAAADRLKRSSHTRHTKSA